MRLGKRVGMTGASHHEEEHKKAEKAVEDLKMREDLAHRYLNEGFSGGERKRNEILQLKVLKPKFAILDEIDSGLDVDALKIVGENVSNLINENFGCILITHYQRILDHIKPNFVHIMIDGVIVLSGGMELIEKIDLPVVISSALDSSVGISHGLSLAAAVPNLYGACGLGTVALLDGDVTSEPLLAASGLMRNHKIIADRVSEFKVAPDRQSWWQDRADAIYEGGLL